MTQIIQQLSVFLKGGQNIIVPFNAEKADVFNPQIEAFIKAIGDKEKKNRTTSSSRVPAWCSCIFPTSRPSTW